MIPSPGNRHQQREDSMTTTKSSSSVADADLEEESSRVLLFNGLATTSPATHLTGEDELIEEEEEDDDQVEVIGEEEDEFEYLRLDTIVEEDENSELDCDEQQLSSTTDDSECDTTGALPRTRQQQHRNQRRHLSTTTTTGTTPPTASQKSNGLTRAPDGIKATPQQQLASNKLLGVVVMSSANNDCGDGDDDDDDEDDDDEVGDRRPLAEQQVASLQSAPQTNSMRKFTSTTTTGVLKFHSALSENNNMDNNKCDTSVAKSQNNNNNNINLQPLPSTNRLISEHQVRQQQTLFKALAQRQRLMDELGADERDLMSANFGSLGNINNNQQQQQHITDTSGSVRHQRKKVNHRRHKRSRKGNKAPVDGVPLSALDLSSMSDRMLDELLGHIASASSSSLSSNGESLDSSDLSAANTSSTSSSDSGSCSSDCDANETKAQRAPSNNKRRSRHRTGTESSSSSRLRSSAATSSAARTANDAPNVVGVHEDERQRQAHRRTCDNQRRPGNSHNDDGGDADDDDDQADHELLVQLNPPLNSSNGLQSGESLSPQPTSSSSQQQQQLNQPSPELELIGTDVPKAQPDQQLRGGLRSSKLEDYFTSGLVNPHEYSALNTATATAAVNKQHIESPEGDCPAATPTRSSESVEEVLSRMLEALQEISVSDEATGGEQLNELLERGFAHLEQLLQCNLGPQSSGNNSICGVGTTFPANQQRLSKTTLNGKTQCSALLLSKDSDYGSDTQSADCLSQCADTSAGNSSSQPLLLTDSPSPTSLATTSSGGSGASGLSGNTGNSKLGALSPLAVELSFKLAESLHRLAQQQAARRTSSEQQHQQQQRPVPVPVTQARKTPMKSVVLLNSSTTTSTATQRADSAASPVGAKSSSPASPQRNVTPESGASEKPLRAQFKTCVNIGGGGGVKAAVSNVTVAPSPLKDKAATAAEFQQLDSSSENDLNNKSSEQENNNSSSRLINEQEQTSNNIQQQLERRRSSRASLRRRPSFSGSTTSLMMLQQQHSGTSSTRPGSPLPRPLGEELSAAAAATEESASVNHSNAKRSQQLQKALVMAQKYNYSPAKLAASKLSSKLHLKELTRQTSGEEQRSEEQQDSKKEQQQQHYSTDYYSATAMAINGTQTLKEPTRMNARLQDSSGWSSKTSGQQQQAIRVSGQVQLDISYFAKSGSLSVHVLQCTHLAPVSKRRSTSNPYVKLYLLPDRTKSGKRKSAIQRNQLNPKFNEEFTFGPIPLSDFDQKTLWLSVWHKDRLGRNEFLGEIYLPLSQVRRQLLNSDTCQCIATQWYPLRERFDNSASLKQAQRQLPYCQPESLKKPTITGTTNRRQVETAAAAAADIAADKLSELQRKAARLTTAVAPPEGRQTHCSDKPTMNVTLGIAPPLHLSANVTGQLFVALKFEPDNQREHLTASRAAQATGQLQVIIKEAHNIGGFEAPALITGRLPTSGQPPPSGPLPNPICKCYLLSSSGQRLAKQKTPSMKRTANPQWNHKCIFAQLKLSQLACQAIEIQMFNRDSILVSNNEYLGGIRLCSQPYLSGVADDSSSQQSGDSLRRAASSNSTTTTAAAAALTMGSAALITPADIPEEGALCSEREARLWSQMLAKPNIWVYGELRLRPLRPLVSLSNNSNSNTVKRSSLTSITTANTGTGNQQLVSNGLASRAN